MAALPLPGNARHDPDPAGASFIGGRGLLHLNIQLIDEQERHAGLQIIEHLLKCGLFHLATDDQPHVAVLGLCPDHINLRGLDGAADIADGGGDPLQQRGAGDRHRRPLEERRARMLGE